MKQSITKEIADKIMTIDGEVRGVVFKTDGKFIEEEKGLDGLKKLENKLKELGYPISYSNIHTMNFYPMGLRVLSLLAIHETFNFCDEDLTRMGAQSPKFSLIIKLFAKFFTSISKTINQASMMWKKHYTVGNLIAEANEDENWALIKLTDLKTHPLFEVYLEGYLKTIVQMIVRGQVHCRITKSPNKNNKDKYTEYKLTW